jgi:hypothetical protein
MTGDEAVTVHHDKITSGATWMSTVDLPVAARDAPGAVGGHGSHCVLPNVATWRSAPPR